jgi:hypothetical protein
MSELVTDERLAELRNGRLERLPSYLSAIDRVDLCKAIDEITALRRQLREAAPALEAGASAIAWSGQHEEEDVRHADQLRSLASKGKGV